MISLAAFRKKLSSLELLTKPIPSKSGKASYKRFLVDNDEVKFVRVNTGHEWSLSINELYKVYENNSFINTTVVKNLTGKRVSSPSVAILMAINCIDINGKRIK